MTNQASIPILPLTSPKVTFHMAGGKGTNLNILAMAGFPVPPGFIIPTSAYQVFLEANHLQASIQTALSEIDASNPIVLEKTSLAIRSVFASCRMPEEIKSEIYKSYGTLGQPAVAVRSSATFEDLPDLSFAGQQDTYLNITSDEMLIQKVIECWSSLWTARAIGYRLHQNVPQDEIAMAVVVQKMVDSETSGVLFTANPLTGLRSEVVIDATLGLGEALVSGLVEPDHYVVDTINSEIKRKTLGSKIISIRSAENGGVRKVSENDQEHQALDDDQILRLAGLGQKVQEHFGSPQDIEWCYGNGHLYILQSRPITTLFPLPVGLTVEPLKIFMSFANVQGMMDPITPIGQSAVKSIFATGAELFEIHVDEESQTVLYSAGERFWINITALIKNSFGRKVLPVVLESVEPTIRQAVLQIQDDPRLQPGKKGVSIKARLQLAHFVLPLIGNVFLNILLPTYRRKFIVTNGETILKKLDSILGSVTGNRFEKLAFQSVVLRKISNKYLNRTLILFISGVASGIVCWNILNMLAKKTKKNNSQENYPSDLVLQITRGMPFNPTTEMDLALWQMTQSIRCDPPSLQIMLESSPDQLSQLYKKGSLPNLLTEEICKFLDRYGGRGLGEIDLGRTRWAENPTHVFEMLSSFMQMEDTDNTPDIIFGRGVASANQAIEQLIADVKKTNGGFIKAMVVRFLADRARKLMGMRESPKFFAVRMMWAIHRELIKTGQEFVEAGELDHADDLFYLTFPEIRSFAARRNGDWRELINVRRALYKKELRRHQIPRLIMSDGRAFYEGMNTPPGQDNTSLTGSPVSPGIIEGLVRVILNPSTAGLIPGEIMVCPGTDPSWTPLFMAASGLVMEVGGMMTHGAVVAREYGIPAVVGVTNATIRLTTGQRIRLNGSNGEITLLN